jgi:hypothetical protein
MQFLESVAARTNKSFELGLPIRREKALLRGIPASHPLLADALLYGQTEAERRARRRAAVPLMRIENPLVADAAVKPNTTRLPIGSR